jgi:hypothetical protein
LYALYIELSSYWFRFDAGSGSVLFVADMLHPIDDFAVQRFLNRDVCHCGCGCCSMPMLLTGRKPDDITWVDFLDWAVPTLRPSEP